MILQCKFVESVRFSLKTYVFDTNLSSFGEKIIKNYLHQDYHLVKNDPTVQICGKRSYQPEHVHFCEKWFFAVI